jgi:hypothetical protein
MKTKWKSGSSTQGKISQKEDIVSPALLYFIDLEFAALNGSNLKAKDQMRAMKSEGVEVDWTKTAGATVKLRLLTDKSRQKQERVSRSLKLKMKMSLSSSWTTKQTFSR